MFLCGQLLDFQLTANVLVHRELLMMTAYLHVGHGGNFLILKRVALSLQLSRPVDGGGGESNGHLKILYWVTKVVHVLLIV